MKSPTKEKKSQAKTKDLKKEIPSNDKLKKEEEQKAKEAEENQLMLLKKLRFPFQFLYRREIYEIPNQKYDTTLKTIIGLISKKLGISSNDFTVSFKNQKLEDLSIKIYDLIKDERDKLFTVKKKRKYKEFIFS